MQNAGLAALGLNWRYLAFDVHPDHLREAIAGAKSMKFIGLNLTVPHKLLAIKMVDVLDCSAEKWGAINTIRFEGLAPNRTWTPLSQLDPEKTDDVRSVGFNTDADAIIRALREDLDLEPRGASVLLLGAGGAGQTAALRLAEEGIQQLFLVNRTSAKAAELADQVRSRFKNTEVAAGYPKRPVDLVVNATSLGLKPDQPLPLDEQQFSLQRTRAVYDMIYRPAETPLLQRARKAGVRTANGLGMLLYQGVKALEIWTDTAGPTQVMRRALEANIYGTCNF
jgi:shikimate dehydrogenase